MTPKGVFLCLKCLSSSISKRESGIIEMNKTNSLDRNIEYMERISRVNIVIGKKNTRVKTLQINLNGFSFYDDDMVNYFLTKDEHGRIIGNKVLVNVSIPMIRKKDVY